MFSSSDFGVLHMLETSGLDLDLLNLVKPVRVLFLISVR